jgi:GWxTD domain-containing protein
MTKRWLALASLIALLPAHGVRAQTGFDAGTPVSLGGIRFATDVVAAPSIEGRGAIEITYSVIYDELVFLKLDDGGYRARIEVTAVVYDDEGKQVAGDSWRKTIDVDSYDKTNSRAEAIREVVSLPVEPGSYRVKLEVSSLDTPAFGVTERRIDVPEVAPGGLAIGTLTFERRKYADPNAADIFARNPTREYGEDYPTVRVRIPIYADPGTRLVLAWFVEGADGAVQISGADTVAQSSFLTEYTREFSALGLQVGPYVVRVRVRPVAGGDGQVASSRFLVITSPESWGEDFEKMVAQVSYVATRDEVERILDAAPEDRDEAWRAFWGARDPDPSTPENEFKTEFLRRLGYANTKFRSVVEGWQTDMGRVYIQYGEPDDIDSQPIGRMLNAWETWYYYSEHKKFIFVDRDGFGEFKLVESSRI